MSSSKVKFGVVGCGDIATRNYIPSMVANEQAHLMAVCDTVEERAKAAKSQGGASEYYTDYDKMLKEADIDAVVVLTPIKTHAPLSIKAAEAGRHILTQKSMATRLDDAQDMVTAVRKSGIKCVVEPAPQLGFGVQKAKELVDNETLGKVCIAYGTSSHGGALHAAWFYTDPESGGVLMDMGVYAISTLTAVLGPAKAVTGMATVSIENRPIRAHQEIAGDQRDLEPTMVKATAPDNTVTLMDFGGRTIGCVLSNFCTRGRANLFASGRGYEFYCEKGAFSIGMGGVMLNSAWGPAGLQHIGFLSLGPNKPFIPEMKPSYEEGEAFGLKGWLVKRERGESMRLPPRTLGARAHKRGALSHLIECIQEDAELLPNVEWGCHVPEIMVKSLESSKIGRRLNLVTTF